MHNALRWFLLWTLFPFVIVAADPPPPLVRSVLSTNLPPFGLTGQALFRTANLPYLDWSNIVQQVIDTNAFQPASANLTNWSLISTNALTGKLDSNVWWAAWGSLDTNALTGKLDSNYWFTVWGAIATNALTDKLDSNWWWTAYGSKVLTNAGAFIASQTGFGTNTTFRSSANTTVPLVISNQIGSTTNSFEIPGTNGVGLGKDFVITSDGKAGFGTNLPQAVFDFYARSNGPSQYILRVANGMVANGSNAFLIGTNGGIGMSTVIPNVKGALSTAATITSGGDVWSKWFYYSVSANNGLRGDSQDLTAPTLARQFAGFSLIGSGLAGSPSNNLFVAGQLIASNGVVARVHSTYATNVPPLSVEPFTGQATNAMQVLGTNRTSMIVDSNGVTQVNPGGGLNPVGCYGALMMNATNIVVCAGAASVYTNIAGTGYTTIVTNGFYGDTNGNSSALTNLYAGYYRVQASVSYVGANAGAYEAEVFTNNVSCDLIGWKDTFDTPARLRNGGAVGIIYLPAGCRTSVRIQDGGAGTSIAIQRTSLVIGTP